MASMPASMLVRIVSSVVGKTQGPSPAPSPTPTPTPTPTPAPSFNTQPAIFGTPTVGQPLSALTFVDPSVSNGSITARTYLLASVSKALSYVLVTGDIGASLTFKTDVSGPGGANSATSPGVIVVAATPTPTPTPSAILAPVLTPQANPTSYPPTPDVSFPVDSNAPRVGDNIRVLASPNFDRSSPIINDASYVLTGNVANDKAAILAKLASIGSGIGYVFLRPERGATIGDWSVPAQYGTATVPALMSGPDFNVFSSQQLAANLIYASPVLKVLIYGPDMIKAQIVAEVPGTNFTLEWLNNLTQTYNSHVAFDGSNTFRFMMEVWGLNGKTRRDAVSVAVQDYDTTPTDITVSPVSNADQSTYVEFGPYTVADIADDYMVPVSMSGGVQMKSKPAGDSYGSYSSASASLAEFTEFYLRIQSSGTYLGNVSGTFNYGPFTKTVSVTTKVDPTSASIVESATPGYSHDFGFASSAFSAGTFAFGAGYDIVEIYDSAKRNKTVKTGTTDGTGGLAAIKLAEAGETSLWQVPSTQGEANRGIYVTGDNAFGIIMAKALTGVGIGAVSSGSLQISTGAYGHFTEGPTNPMDVSGGKVGIVVVGEVSTIATETWSGATGFARVSQYDGSSLNDELMSAVVNASGTPSVTFTLSAGYPFTTYIALVWEKL